ncbi:MAG: helix-turn-helix domain-containing protein [Candidatus Ventricola sp.]
MVDFGSRLRLLRQAKHITQKQLADQLRLTKSVISAYETDLRLPSYDILIKISAIFGVTTDYLLGVNHGQLIDISSLNEADSQMVIQLINRLKN